MKRFKRLLKNGKCRDAIEYLELWNLNRGKLICKHKDFMFSKPNDDCAAI